MDAKATVKVGPLARGGKNRVPTVAADHDLPPDATVTPVGISLPALEELFLYGSTSKVPSDCLVACLVRWWEVVHDRCAHLTTLVSNLDHGPEGLDHGVGHPIRLWPGTSTSALEDRSVGGHRRHRCRHVFFLAALRAG